MSLRRYYIAANVDGEVASGGINHQMVLGLHLLPFLDLHDEVLFQQFVLVRGLRPNYSFRQFQVLLFNLDSLLFPDSEVKAVFGTGLSAGVVARPFGVDVIQLLLKLHVCVV